MSTLKRWPLLLAAALCLGGALGVEWAGAAAPAGLVLLGLGAACLGAFLYAEGARHREWLDEHRHAGRGTGLDNTPDP